MSNKKNKTRKTNDSMVDGSLWIKQRGAIP